MIVLDAMLVTIAMALGVAVVRLIVGPADADRVIGLDFAFVALIAGVSLLAVRLDTLALLDLVLAATLVGFLATVAIARLIEERSS